MPEPLYSDIIFQEQPSISQLLTSLKRSTLTIHNRLTSIHSDAAFVSRVAESYARPLVANERCGSWYVPPGEKKGSAYFKSTDGHERAWKFSTRRLNLHLIDMIEENDGIVIVDSTRRGKRMPDALSTTIPIWCTIINLTLLPNNPLSQLLHLPPSLPPTTHAQITALLPYFLSSLAALNLTLPTSLTKPLRPFWITQDSVLGESTDQQIFEDYRPVICCTASRRVVRSEMDEEGYIQGAGDDSENWGHGLTPTIFWQHAQELLEEAEAGLPNLIRIFVAQHSTDVKEGETTVKLTHHVSVCPLPLDSDSDCCIALTSNVTPREAWIKSPRYMEIGLGKHKAASKNLRLAFPDICAFVSENFRLSTSPEDWQLVAACESGRDISVGTALALSCYLFDEDGNVRNRDVGFTKTMVKIRLGRFMSVFPGANPSRATLQSVNSFLMDWRN